MFATPALVVAVAAAVLSSWTSAAQDFGGRVPYESFSRLGTVIEPGFDQRTKSAHRDAAWMPRSLDISATILVADIR
eukprot:1069571-Prorocentrum_minimum.AAC.3